MILTTYKDIPITLAGVTATSGIVRGKYSEVLSYFMVVHSLGDIIKAVAWVKEQLDNQFATDEIINSCLNDE